MGILEYQNEKGDILYIFDGEGNPPHGYRRVFSTVPIVQSTAKFMLEDAVLDSMITIHELDAELTREAAEEREMKYFQEAIRNI